MKYYSTKNRNKFYSLREAVLKGLPEDNGLFMPEMIQVLSPSVLASFRADNIPAIGYALAKNFIEPDISSAVLENICTEAFNFPVPIVKLNDNTYVAELFHGPTLAFKDFGARFMARIMSSLNSGEKKILTILVATSGDTGGAVADGFYGVEGIEVFILYPSGGVSELQEKQLTTYGKNIRAIEVKGTFDDCQRMVKSAFLDKELLEVYRLSSANSINISRLIPQMVYYFTSFAQLENGSNAVFVVPSGNFGNLTAGLFAKRMGLHVSHFVSATNVNDTVPLFLSGNGFNPKASVDTISNAMDVGNPSNFGRMLELFHDSLEAMQKEITAFSITDQKTEEEMRKIFNKYSYIIDPHGAVGIAGWNAYCDLQKGTTGIILETAHPAKFLESVERILGIKLTLPSALENLKSKTKNRKKVRSITRDKH